MLKSQPRNCSFPEGPTIKKNKSRSKFSISIEIFKVDRKFQSRRRKFPTKNRAAVGGSLENFILTRNLQSRSKSRFFLLFGPSGFCQGPLNGGISPGGGLPDLDFRFVLLGLRFRAPVRVTHIPRTRKYSKITTNDPKRPIPKIP